MILYLIYFRQICRPIPTIYKNSKSLLYLRSLAHLFGDFRFSIGIPNCRNTVITYLIFCFWFEVRIVNIFDFLTQNFENLLLNYHVVFLSKQEINTHCLMPSSYGIFKSFTNNFFKISLLTLLIVLKILINDRGLLQQNLLRYYQSFLSLFCILCKK